MTTEHIREVPSDLPRARLYIEEISEIEKIITNVLDAAAGASFEYVIEDTLRITTLDELLSHGGNTTRFELVLVTSSYSHPIRQSLLRFKAGTFWNEAPRFSCPYDLKDREFDLYARVLSIFQGRQLRIANALQELPSWIIGPVEMLPIMLLLPQLDAVQFGHPKLSLLFFCLEILGVREILLAHRKSKVYLVRHRQDTLAKKQRANERIEKIMWLIVGALIGSVATIITPTFQALGLAHTSLLCLASGSNLRLPPLPHGPASAQKQRLAEKRLKRKGQHPD